MVGKLKILFIIFYFTINYLTYLSASDLKNVKEGATKFLHSNDKTMVLIGGKLRDIIKYTKKINISPSGFLFYSSIKSPIGFDLNLFPLDKNCANLFELIKMYPNKVLHLSLYTLNDLKFLDSKKYIENIKKLVFFLKQIKIPVYLRIGYPPYNSSEKNLFNPENYKKCYLYILKYLRESNVNNVSYVWHPSIEKNTLDEWYPGDEYVDWVGISIARENNFSKFDKIMNFAKKHNKEVMIAHASPLNIGVKDNKSWDLWFKPFFEFINKNKIKIINYHNEHNKIWWIKNKKINDYRIGVNPVIKEKWINEISKNRYVHSDEELFKNLNFQDTK